MMFQKSEWATLSNQDFFPLNWTQSHLAPDERLFVICTCKVTHWPHPRFSYSNRCLVVVSEKWRLQLCSRTKKNAAVCTSAIPTPKLSLILRARRLHEIISMVPRGRSRWIVWRGSPWGLLKSWPHRYYFTVTAAEPRIGQRIELVFPKTIGDQVILD